MIATLNEHADWFLLDRPEEIPVVLDNAIRTFTEVLKKNDGKEILLDLASLKSTHSVTYLLVNAGRTRRRSKKVTSLPLRYDINFFVEQLNIFATSLDEIKKQMVLGSPYGKILKDVILELKNFKAPLGAFPNQLHPSSLQLIEEWKTQEQTGEK